MLFITRAEYKDFETLIKKSYGKTDLQTEILY